MTMAAFPWLLIGSVVLATALLCIVAMGAGFWLGRRDLRVNFDSENALESKYGRRFFGKWRDSGQKEPDYDDPWHEATVPEIPKEKRRITTDVDS